MSEQTQVDLDKLIRAGGVLQGEFAVRALDALTDRLASPEGVVAWSLSGIRDAHGRPRLKLVLGGQLELVCQRCLQPLMHHVEAQAGLVVVREESAMPDLEEEDDEADFVLVPGLFDVREAVLEELLLVLPMMPRHETAECHGPAVSEVEEDVAGETRVSPFEVLRRPSGG